MKLRLFALLALVALFAAPAVVAEEAAKSTEALPSIEAQVTTETVSETTPEPVLFADADHLFKAEAFHCPFGAPSCSRDKQCDAYCGVPGWGACERFCCACLG